MYLKIQLKASKKYLFLMLLLHLFSIGVFIIYFENRVRWLLSAMMMVSFFYCYFMHYGNSAKKIREIQIQTNGNIQLKIQSNHLLKATLHEVLMKNKYWITICWTINRRKLIQTIFSDMCSYDEYHCLFLWVSWLASKSKYLKRN